MNTPLQLGGLAQEKVFAEGWTNVPRGEPFTGCLRNLIVNGKVVDLGEDTIVYKGSEAGCPVKEELCSACGSSGK